MKTLNIIRKLIKKWNRHTIKKCLAKGPGDVRAKKILENINTGIDTQYIYADICLMLLPVPTKRVALESFNDFPVWKKSSRSNVYVFEERKKEDRLKILKNRLSELNIE